LKNKFYILLIFFILPFLSGCGDITTTDEGSIYIPTATPIPTYTATPTPIVTVEPSPLPTEESANSEDKGVRIIGKITYDRIPVKSSAIGLNYNNIREESAKQVIIKLVKNSCATTNSSDIIATTTTDDNGNYEFNNLPTNQDARICVYAQMKREGVGGWSLKVVDNTNADALYTMQSNLFSIGENSTRRNLNASSGWGGSGYSSTRTAAPFAILDSVYQAMKKVISADSTATFPELKINWSINNVPSGDGGEAGLRDGQIVTSHYNGDGNLYILGDANSDTDEYDNHIIIHEWGHYFEANFSRADSIGGSHGDGDKLDIRVAFGEGWGNAWSAIVTDNPIYYDTMGRKQSNGFSMNIESEFTQNPGWYSEDSIQKILYDLYDSHNDGGDTLSLGFKPIYDVLVGSQKTTPAFTSIFSFITYLKENNPSAINKIDDILASENIESIQNIYGSTIDSDLYSDMSNGSINICTYSQYGRGNKLYNHRYIRFSISQNGNYTVRVKQSDGSNSDPDFSLYKTAPFINMGASEESVFGVESHSYSLSSDDYLLDVSDYNNLRRACFDITVN
jgi:hypothetical protein